MQPFVGKDVWVVGFQHGSGGKEEKTVQRDEGGCSFSKSLPLPALRVLFLSNLLETSLLSLLAHGTQTDNVTSLLCDGKG